ncbi:serine protease 27-like [Panonychus citri]|uniref:serine protease 27-like n=1 Tax=Panonychus citri TaxID=50023 RepID=UPI0023075CCE|nr:serine protease 27-like [Panonychus citri]
MCLKFIFILIFYYYSLSWLNRDSYCVLGVPRKNAGCGKQHIPRESRVVAGNDTYDGEFPWTVSVRRNGDHICGGVIIAKRWILTAAHCVYNRSPTSFMARIGEFHLYRPDHHSRDYSIEKIVIHTDYAGIVDSETGSKADIALLRTRQEIRFSEYAWPVCVPSSEISYAGQEAVVVGWGKQTEKSEVYSDTLQKAKLSVLDNEKCQNWYRSSGYLFPIHDHLICAGYQKGGRDACHGDSGGPLLYKLADHWAVIGVVSTGVGCARPLLPGLYSRVSSYVDWIGRYLAER